MTSTISVESASAGSPAQTAAGSGPDANTLHASLTGSPSAAAAPGETAVRNLLAIIAASGPAGSR